MLIVYSNVNEGWKDINKIKLWKDFKTQCL